MLKQCRRFIRAVVRYQVEQEILNHEYRPLGGVVDPNPSGRLMNALIYLVPS